MRIIKFQFSTFDLVFENGKMETRTFTPLELAGFKRSKQYKTLVNKKLLLQWEVKIKTL